MYKHFIFDVDGTLIDTEKTAVLSLKQTILELLGKDMPYDEVRKYYGCASASVGPALGATDIKLFAETWEIHFQELMYMTKPFDGVVEMLKTLKEAGVKVGFVTSRNAFECSYDPNLKLMMPYFDYTVSADDSVRHKPDPDPMLAYIRKASEALGEAVDPKDCIYIGDTAFDYGCGHGAGCDFGLMDWYGRGRQDVPAEYYFTSAEGVLALLK